MFSLWSPGYGPVVRGEGIQLTRQGEATAARQRDRNATEVFGKWVSILLL